MVLEWSLEKNTEQMEWNKFEHWFIDWLQWKEMTAYGLWSE